LQQVPHAVGDTMLSLSGAHGTWPFILLSIAVLIVMGSVLEGAAANIPMGRSMLRPTTRLPSAWATMEYCPRRSFGVNARLHFWRRRC
jgi:hypothetical protein